MAYSGWNWVSSTVFHGPRVGAVTVMEVKCPGPCGLLCPLVVGGGADQSTLSLMPVSGILGDAVFECIFFVTCAGTQGVWPAPAWGCLPLWMGVKCVFLPLENSPGVPTLCLQPSWGLSQLFMAKINAQLLYEGVCCNHLMYFWS